MVKRTFGSARPAGRMAVLALVAALIAGLLAWLPAPSARAAAPPVPVPPASLRSAGMLPAGGTVQVDTGVLNKTVFGNLTVTQAQGPGYLTVYPCSERRPLASNINFVAGQTIANMATVSSGDDGKICIYASATTHVVWDQGGDAGRLVVSTAPKRLVDTRATAWTRAKPNSPGDMAPAGTKLRPGEEVVIGGLGGGGGFVGGNLTVTQPEANGWAAAYKCGSTKLTSSINFVAGQTIAAFVITAPTDGGAICLKSSAATHVIWDQATHGTGITHAQFPGTRVLDTRSESQGGLKGNPAWRDLAGKSHPAGEMPRAGTTIVIPVGDWFAAGTLTATGSKGDGWLSARCDIDSLPPDTPRTSNVNFTAGASRANSIAVPSKISLARADVCVYVSSDTHVVFDLAMTSFIDASNTDAISIGMQKGATRKLDTREMVWSKPAVQRFGVEIPWTVSRDQSADGRFGVLRVHFAPVTGATYTVSWESISTTSTETDNGTRSRVSRTVDPNSTCGDKAAGLSTGDYVPAGNTIGYAQEPMLATDLCFDINMAPNTSVSPARVPVWLRVDYPQQVDSVPTSTTAASSIASECPAGVLFVARGTSEAWDETNKDRPYRRADGNDRLVETVVPAARGLGGRGSHVYATILDSTDDLPRINPWAFRAAAVRYPALPDFSDKVEVWYRNAAGTYAQSRSAGMADINRALDGTWTGACSTPISLFGYSQGADVAAQVYSDRLAARNEQPSGGGRGFDLITQVSLLSDAGNDMLAYPFNAAASAPFNKDRRIPLPQGLVDGQTAGFTFPVNSGKRVSPIKGPNAKAEYEHYCWVGDSICSAHTDINFDIHGPAYDAYEPVAARSIRLHAVAVAAAGASPASALGRAASQEPRYFDWNTDGSRPGHALNSVYSLPDNVRNGLPYPPVVLP